MIYLNNEVNELLNIVAPSKYEISSEGAILHMIEQDRFMEAINRAIDLDYLTLQEETSLKDLGDALKSKDYLKFVIKLIDALISIISNGIRVIIAITKKFLYRASEVNKSNAEFMKKYGQQFKDLLNISVEIDGYAINRNLNSIAIGIENISDTSFNDAKTLLMDGKVVFKDKESLINKIAEDRYSILSKLSYNSDLYSLGKDRVWMKEIDYACFGDKRKIVYTVNDAIGIINGFDQNKNFIKSLSSKVTQKHTTDINNLKQLKQIMLGNPKYANNKEIVEQFELLNRYRTQTMKDITYTYEVLLKYIDTINLQAKAICIKALQEN